MTTTVLVLPILCSRENPLRFDWMGNKVLSVRHALEYKAKIPVRVLGTSGGLLPVTG